MQNLLKDLQARLDGRKTYLVATALAVFNVLVQFDVIHLASSKIALVNALLAAAGLGGLRLALNK